MRERLALIFNFPSGGYAVAGQRYAMVSGTFEPVMPGILEIDGPNLHISPHIVLALDPTVECEIP